MEFEYMVGDRVSFKKYNFGVARKFGDLWMDSTVANEKQKSVTI
jgi:hypothetical protein